MAVHRAGLVENEDEACGQVVTEARDARRRGRKGRKRRWRRRNERDASRGAIGRGEQGDLLPEASPPRAVPAIAVGVRHCQRATLPNRHRGRSRVRCAPAERRPSEAGPRQSPADLGGPAARGHIDGHALRRRGSRERGHQKDGAHAVQRPHAVHTGGRRVRVCVCRVSVGVRGGVTPPLSRRHRHA